MHIPQLLTRYVSFFSRPIHEHECEKEVVTITETIHTTVHADAFTSYLKPSATISAVYHVTGIKLNKQEETVEANRKIGQLPLANLFFPGFMVMPTDLPTVERRASSNPGAEEEPTSATSTRTTTTSATTRTITLHAAEPLSSHHPTAAANGLRIPRWVHALGFPFTVAARRLPGWKSGSWNTSTHKAHEEYPDIEHFPWINASNSSEYSSQDHRNSSSSAQSLTPEDVHLLVNPETGEPGVGFVLNGSRQVVYLAKERAEGFCNAFFEKLTSTTSTSSSSMTETTTPQTTTMKSATSTNPSSSRSTKSTKSKAGPSPTTCSSFSSLSSPLSPANEFGALLPTLTPWEPTQHPQTRSSSTSTSSSFEEQTSTPIPASSQLPTTTAAQTTSSLPAQVGRPVKTPGAASEIDTAVGGAVGDVTITQYATVHAASPTVNNNKTVWKVGDYTSDAVSKFKFKGVGVLRWLRHLVGLDDEDGGDWRKRKVKVKRGVQAPSSTLRDAETALGSDESGAAPSQISESSTTTTSTSTSAPVSESSTTQSDVIIIPQPTQTQTRTRRPWPDSPNAAAAHGRVLPNFYTRFWKNKDRLVEQKQKQKQKQKRSPYPSASKMAKQGLPVSHDEDGDPKLTLRNLPTSSVPFPSYGQDEEVVTETTGVEGMGITGTGTDTLTSKSVFTPGPSASASAIAKTMPTASVPNVPPMPTSARAHGAAQGAYIRVPGASMLDVGILIWVLVIGTRRVLGWLM
ncbi:hypothetical protein BDV96DRAFT_667312 [Lophiotrema nucula]|uniref:Uncharacterized protein n=1 Tax=Lophiotrema nucula TaxID=690887 RepID=A0A6A5YT85_9PLEO|nr:hypothetical protein BDV96DRAFT_667312 [Lophiotrema nucula]